MGIEHKTSESSATGSAAEAKQGASNNLHILWLVIGDAIVFLIFAAIGRRSHNEAAGLSAIGQIVLTALPFAAGWFIVSPFVGAFKHNIVGQPKKMAARTAISWLASWPLGMLLRIGSEGISGNGWYIPQWTFFLVTLITNMIFLQVWRVPFAWFTRKRSRSQSQLKTDDPLMFPDVFSKLD
jgi:hypothetical protein